MNGDWLSEACSMQLVGGEVEHGECELGDCECRCHYGYDTLARGE